MKRFSKFLVAVMVALVLPLFVACANGEASPGNNNNTDNVSITFEIKCGSEPELLKAPVRVDDFSGDDYCYEVCTQDGFRMLYLNSYEHDITNKIVKGEELKLTFYMDYCVETFEVKIDNEIIAITSVENNEYKVFEFSFRAEESTTINILGDFLYLF